MTASQSWDSDNRCNERRHACTDSDVGEGGDAPSSVTAVDIVHNQTRVGVCYRQRVMQHVTNHGVIGNHEMVLSNL
jgi:hypothetical protein